MIDKKKNVTAFKASNVDDLIYGCEPGAEPVIEKILDHFQVGKGRERSFQVLRRECYTVG